MGQVRMFLSVAGLAVLCACGGLHYPTSGTDPNSSSPLVTQGVTASVTSKDLSARNAGSAYAAGKLIALTFDDGPRPYVLFGSKGGHVAPGLVDVLEQNGVKATFFVVGWRLTPKTWGEPRHEEDIGMTCIDAAEQLTKRGHELEDHTYSHMELRSAEKKMGEPWVTHDVDRGAQAIKAITGTQPRYLRPPDWMITSDARRELQHHGYHVLTISSENPMALRDVNSLDYLCAGKNPTGCPRPSLVDGVLKQVEQREKRGVYTHILAFHELTSTATVMPRLITDLKARGYRFVTLAEYMDMVASKADQPVKQQAAGKGHIRVAALSR